MSPEGSGAQREKAGFARDGIQAVGPAIRQAFLRAANADPPLKRGEWKALAAVVAEVSSWLRLEDDMTLEHLATSAALGARELGRRLAELRDRAIVIYRPGRGGRGGVVSRVGLPEANDWRASSPLKRGLFGSSTRAPVKDDAKQSHSGVWVARNDDFERSTRAPLSIEDPLRVSSTPDGVERACHAKNGRVQESHDEAMKRAVRLVQRELGGRVVPGFPVNARRFDLEEGSS